MEKALPLNIDLCKRGIATPNLKMVFGTDAVAGANGRNEEEFLYRVRDCAQDPMAAMVSANSLAAESPGMEADIIALTGTPSRTSPRSAGWSS